VAWSRTASLSLKLHISERSREAKMEWHKNPKRHRKDEIPTPAPKKSCMDGGRNSIARAAAQIRTGHGTSAIYLKRINKRTSDNCWFCEGGATMTRTPGLRPHPSRPPRQCIHPSFAPRPPPHLHHWPLFSLLRRAPGIFAISAPTWGWPGGHTVFLRPFLPTLPSWPRSFSRLGSVAGCSVIILS
jgi:hypothetical protein